MSALQRFREGEVIGREAASLVGGGTCSVLGTGITHCQAMLDFQRRIFWEMNFLSRIYQNSRSHTTYPTLYILRRDLRVDYAEEIRKLTRRQVQRETVLCTVSATTKFPTISALDQNYASHRKIQSSKPQKSRTPFPPTSIAPQLTQWHLLILRDRRWPLLSTKPA